MIMATYQAGLHTKFTCSCPAVGCDLLFGAQSNEGLGWNSINLFSYSLLFAWEDLYFCSRNFALFVI